jgi:penicillin G amidase
VIQPTNISRSSQTILNIFKIILFSGGLIAGPISAAEVTIIRDEHGTPHIYAEDTYGIYYGYGYSIAQDRLYQMDMAKRSTQGTVAEVLGAEYVDFDVSTRANYDPASIMSQLAQLNEDDRHIFEGYAAGMNDWIDEVIANQESLMPKQFIDNDFQPEHWTGFDVAMIFIGSMGNRFGDYNTELENQQLVNGLIDIHGEATAWNIFNQLNPVYDPTAPTTVPKSNILLTEYPKIEESWFNNLASIEVSTPLSNPGRQQAFSNMVIVGKDKSTDANAILLNGPQFGLYTPAYTYSIGLHGAGFDLVGNSPFGYPAVLFGHNQNISWGSTWGATDVVDIYRETLNPENHDEYLFMGRYMPFEHRKEIIRIKGEETLEIVVLKTVHGLVINMDEANAVAYSKKRTWAGRELDTLLGWVESTKANNHDEWLTQAARSAMNINFYYADNEGNIGYALTGSYPQRLPSHDNRLPASGEGDMEWQGRIPFSENPQVYNPETGYIANWNNRPGGSNLNNPDEFWYSWSRADRVEVFTNLIEAQDSFSAEEIRDLVAETAMTDPNARYFIPYIEHAIADLDANDPIKEMSMQLLDWNFISQDLDSDGYYDDVATVIFQAWLPAMIDAVLKDDLGDFYPMFAGAGHPQPVIFDSGMNIGVGTKTVYEALLGDESGIEQNHDFLNGQDPLTLIRETLAVAHTQLVDRFGSEINDWLFPVAISSFSNRNFLDIPQAGEDEIVSTNIFMNRGTENNQVIFGLDGTITALEAVPPGQSGFIDPDGNKSKYYGNQLEYYDTFNYKEIWLDIEDVNAHADSIISLDI